MKSVKDSTSYETVNAEDVDEVCIDEEHPQSSWMPFLRQLLFSSTAWTFYFINGLQLGTPTVLIAQLKKDSNSFTEVDDDTASWITSLITFGAMPWVLILPILSHFAGRRPTFIFISVIAFIGSLVFYSCNSLTQLFIGEIISGILLGSAHTIGPVTINEYVSPKYRGIFLTVKSASVFWGMWISNFIGTFWYWKNIAILVILCNIYTFTVFIWPESPYWLAKNGKFLECAKSHRWLKGTSIAVEKELDNMISSYKRYREEQSNIKSIFTKEYLNSLYDTAKCKSFYKPVLISVLTGIQYHVSGKFICSMYAIELIKKITKDESAAYKGMLILDGITVFSVYCGCIISQFFKRRTYLLTTSAFAIFLLFLLSLYLYLIRNKIIPENTIVTISLLGLYAMSVSSGPIILLTAIWGEIIPVRFQRSSTIIVGIVAGVAMMLTLKSTLFLFNNLTLAGTFLCYAILSSVILIMLFFYLPETKNKTPSEIEDYFVGVTQ